MPGGPPQRAHTSPSPCGSSFQWCQHRCALSLLPTLSLPSPQAPQLLSHPCSSVSFCTAPPEIVRFLFYVPGAPGPSAWPHTCCVFHRPSKRQNLKQIHQLLKLHVLPVAPTCPWISVSFPVHVVMPAPSHAPVGTDERPSVGGFVDSRAPLGVHVGCCLCYFHVGCREPYLSS